MKLNLKPDKVSTWKQTWGDEDTVGNSLKIEKNTKVFYLEFEQIGTNFVKFTDGKNIQTISGKEFFGTTDEEFLEKSTTSITGNTLEEIIKTILLYVKK